MVCQRENMTGMKIVSSRPHISLREQGGNPHTMWSPIRHTGTAK